MYSGLGVCHFVVVVVIMLVNFGWKYDNRGERFFKVRFGNNCIGND